MMIPLQCFADGDHLSPKAPGHAWRLGEEGCRFPEDSGRDTHRDRPIAPLSTARQRGSETADRRTPALPQPL